MQIFPVVSECGIEGCGIVYHSHDLLLSAKTKKVKMSFLIGQFANISILMDTVFLGFDAIINSLGVYQSLMILS